MINALFLVFFIVLALAIGSIILDNINWEKKRKKQKEKNTVIERLPIQKKKKGVLDGHK